MRKLSKINAVVGKVFSGHVDGFKVSRSRDEEENNGSIIFHRLLGVKFSNQLNDHCSGVVLVNESNKDSMVHASCYCTSDDYSIIDEARKNWTDGSVEYPFMLDVDPASTERMPADAPNVIGGKCTSA